MIRRPPRSTQSRSSAASDVYKRQAPQSLANGALQREELLQNLAGATKSSADSRLSQSISQEVQGANQQPDSDSLETNNANNPFQLASAPRRLADGSPMPELYSGRSPENRQKKASANGGTPQTERAVNDALAWLVSTQEADGSWNGVRHGAGREQLVLGCLLYTSPSPRDLSTSRMPSSA